MDAAGGDGDEDEEQEAHEEGAGEEVEQAWADERMVLEAIYGDDVTCGAGGREVTVRLQLPEACGASLLPAGAPEGSGSVTLHAW